MIGWLVGAGGSVGLSVNRLDDWLVGGTGWRSVDWPLVEWRFGRSVSRSAALLKLSCSHNTNGWDVFFKTDTLISRIIKN